MIFTDYQKAFSIPRLDVYLHAVQGNPVRAIDAYKTNLRMSQALLGALSLFEVTLRNEIDAHYQKKFGSDWLVTQSALNGFLTTVGCETSLNSVKAAINAIINDTRRPFSHNEVVTKLNFGFWCYLFGAKEFPAGGNTLLQIFPRKITGQNQRDVFMKLKYINNMRNRIAHHEPICFNKNKLLLSSRYAINDFALIVELLLWMNYDTNLMFQDIYDFNSEAIHLNNI
jgi:hypothetical protein